MWPNLVYLGIAGLFLGLTLSALWHLRWARRLPALETLGAPLAGKPVLCSVVIAARDEAARIEQTVRRLLAQSWVEAEEVIWRQLA